MPSPLQPLTVVTRDGIQGADGSLAGGAKQLLEDVHAQLMSHHALALRAKGIDPSKIPLPETVVLANWVADCEYTPGIGRVLPSTDAARKAVRKPAPGFNVYVVNQDYGYHSGWAVGSLIMAEKVLQAEMGLSKPAWLDGEWYKTNVLAHA